MRDKLIKWLTGTPPAIIGTWWDGVGVCLVKRQLLPDMLGQFDVVYESCAAIASENQGSAEVLAADMANALRCAVERLALENSALSVGVPAEGIFTKSIKIPAGLSEKQVEQITVVEAVSNLPVPPEEICADFLRNGAKAEALTEEIDIAFCKRSLVDDLDVLAEDAGVSLWRVDRDTQGVHDAALLCIKEQLHQDDVRYPFGILMGGNAGRFVICRSPLDHVVYVLSDRQGDGIDQAELQIYCRRAGLMVENEAPLTQLFAVDDDGAINLSTNGVEMLAKELAHIAPRKLMSGSSATVPIYGLMVATGMSLGSYA